MESLLNGIYQKQNAIIYNFIQNSSIRKLKCLFLSTKFKINFILITTHFFQSHPKTQVNQYILLIKFKKYKNLLFPTVSNTFTFILILHFLHYRRLAIINFNVYFFHYVLIYHIVALVSSHSHQDPHSYSIVII